MSGPMMNLADKGLVKWLKEQQPCPIEPLNQSFARISFAFKRDFGNQIRLLLLVWQAFKKKIIQ